MKLDETIKRVVHNTVLKEDVNDAQKAIDLFQELDAQNAEDFEIFEKLADFYHVRAKGEPSERRGPHDPPGMRNNFGSESVPSAAAETFRKVAQLCDKAGQLLSDYRNAFRYRKVN